MLTRHLNLLAEQQDEMVKQGKLHLYKGLCMQEAALLRIHAKEVPDDLTHTTLLEASDEAMTRALHIDIALAQPV